MELGSMQDLMAMTLSELHSAEMQMLKAAPTLMEAAGSPKLADLLLQHAKATEEQVRRLEQVMRRYGVDESVQSRPMEALLSEAMRIAKAPGEPDVKDAALILAQQRVEHDEIAGYGTAVSFAKLLGDEESARLLAQTLDEEEKTDKALSVLALSKVNRGAEEAAPSA